MPALAGKSLLPALRSSRKPVHTEAIYWEHEGNAAMREGDLKLVREYEKPWELYNLATDRTELNNLMETHAQVGGEMIRRWEAWANKNNVAFPKRFNMYQYLREKQKAK